MPPAVKPAPSAPPSAASTTAARAFVNAQILAINGMVETLTDPLKQQYIELRDRYNAFLTGLPPLEQAGAAQSANWSLDSLLRCIEGANDMIVGLQGRLNDSMAAVTSATAKLATASAESAAATETRLRAEFATETAATATRVALHGTRRTLLATAGLPVPAESLLSLSDEAFTAAQTVAAGRLAAFKAKGLGASLTPRMAYCSAEEYVDFEGLVAKAVVAAPPVVPVAARVEPLAGAPAAPVVVEKKTPVCAF